MVLALLAFPLFGFAVAALGGRQLAHPVLAAGAVIGGISWGLGPWAVGPLGMESLNVLFIIGMLMALWFAVIGVRALIVKGPKAGLPTGL